MTTKQNNYKKTKKRQQKSDFLNVATNKILKLDTETLINGVFVK